MNKEDAISIFERHLGSFEAMVLSKLKYQSLSREIKESSYYHSCDNIYKIEASSFKLHIGFSEFFDGRFVIVVLMFSEEIGKYHQGKFFALDEYVATHGIQNFPSVCQVGEDFDAFCGRYFANLKVAFETYLKDQVTGVSFEEHDPFMGR